MVSVEVQDIYRHFRKAYDGVPLHSSLLDLATKKQAFIVVDNNENSVQHLSSILTEDGSLNWPEPENITVDELKYIVAAICGHRFEVEDKLNEGQMHTCLHFGDALDFLNAWARCIHFCQNTNLSNSPHLLF